MTCGLSVGLIFIKFSYSGVRGRAGVIQASLFRSALNIEMCLYFGLPVVECSAPHEYFVAIFVCRSDWKCVIVLSPIVK